MRTGLFHLVANMYGLWKAGCEGEKAHGWWRITLIYFVSLSHNAACVEAVYITRILKRRVV